jgi:isoquinoline 1-oxidoreductase subunit alpha
MASFNLNVNGQAQSVDCDGSVRLLWVLRDLLGVHGPKYGCGLDVCKACTCHIDTGTGPKAFHPCSVEVQNIPAGAKITTIEGLADPDGTLHPMQQAWLDNDVGQCGYCQPGQIMTAVALVEEARASGTPIDDDLFDGILNICRCGTYHRIREAVAEGAANMP